MAKKKILLRLYNPHDIDLISLMTRHQVDIVKAVYCAITAFAKKESFVIRIPPLREYKLDSRRVYSKHLILDSEKDKRVLQLLDAIDPGYRNNFLKNILRLYLFYPATEVFFTDKKNWSLFEEHYQCLIQGKRYVNAAILNCRRQKNSDSIRNADTHKNAMLVSPKQESITEKSPIIPNSTTLTKEFGLSDFSPKEQVIAEQADIMENELKKNIEKEVFQQKESYMDDSLPDETKLQKPEGDDLTDLFTALLG